MKPELALSIFESSPNAYMVLDRELRFIGANAAYRKLTATHWEDLKDRPLFELFPHDPDAPDNENATILRRSLEKVLATGETDVLASIHYRVPTVVDGVVVSKERVWSATHTPVRDAQGLVVGVHQHTVDVTELHELRRSRVDATEADILRRAAKVQRDNTMLELERRDLLRLFQQAPGFVCFLRGPTHIIELTNPAYDSLVGRSELVGQPIRDALSEIVGQGYVELLDRVYASQNPFAARGMRVSLRRTGGVDLEERFVDFVFQPIVGSNGETEGIFVSGNDVTAERQALDARARAQREVEASASEHRFLTDFLPVQVWTSDPSGALIYVSDTVATYFGTSPEKIIGDGWQAVVHPEDLPSVMERWKHSLETGEPYEVEFRLCRASDGIWRWHVGRAVAYRSADGAIIKWYGTNTDIHDRKQEQREREQLIRVLRLNNADLDRFAHVASHDLKAPLRGISNLATWIEEDLGAGAPAEVLEHVRLLRQRAESMSALVDGILRFARAGVASGETQETDMDHAVSEALALLGSDASHRVQVATGLPRVQAVPTAMAQIWLNLIGNALKHGGDGSIQIRSRQVPSGALFEVIDHGPGVPEALRSVVFEPFRTLNQTSSGSGVGLSIVSRIVEGHGGEVGISDTPGGGATFWFVWPSQPMASEPWA